MNGKRLSVNGKDVFVFDAPLNATHSKYESTSFKICRKNKVLETHTIDMLQTEGVKNVVNVGQLSIADESVVADLFVPVKRGNFYDYEVEGVFYPTAILALKNLINKETGFTNPYVLFLDK